MILASLLLKKIYQVKPVLDKTEYQILDTLRTNYDDYGDVTTYNVIVSIDSIHSVHYAVINRQGHLTYINPDEIKTTK